TALEQAHKLTAIVLDKTGTITKGQPEVTDVLVSERVAEPILQPAGAGLPAPAQPSIENRQAYFLRLAASAERGSEHPLGESIVRSAQAQGLALAEPVGFESIA